ncbi:MAG: GerAB/ArcD/ProY family transporter [Peptococcaceae bacterium]
MKLEGGRISSGQLVFLVISFNLGTALLASPSSQAGHDAWLTILGGMAEGIFCAYVFTSLARKFPGKTLVRYNDLIFGPVIGKLISLAYLSYFFIIATLTLRLFGDFFSGLIFPQTPIIVTIGLLVLICASGVRNGIEVLARCSQVLLPFVFLNIFITTIASIKDIDINNFLPLMDIPLRDFLSVCCFSRALPFGATATFLMIFAAVNNQKKMPPFFLLGLFISGLILIITAIRNTGLLGPTTTISTYSSYQATRLVTIGEVFTRLEILVAINFLAMGFIAISLGYYAVTLGVAQIFGLKTYLPLVIPLGVLLVVFSITQFANYFEYFRFSSRILPYAGLPLELGIPLLSLLIVKLRNIAPQETKKKKE